MDRLFPFHFRSSTISFQFMFLTLDIEAYQNG